jgi:hypothetical protein
VAYDLTDMVYRLHETVQGQARVIPTPLGIQHSVDGHNAHHPTSIGYMAN